MKELKIQWPFAIVRRSQLTEISTEISKAQADFLLMVKKQRTSFEELVNKASHNAYAGIVCASCGKNVFRGDATWVHGNGGKAYCLDPCWHDLGNQSA